MKAGIAIPGYELVIADAQTLLLALPIDRGRVRSRRLFKTAALTVLGVTIDAGAVMREHVAAVPLLIHVVDGHAVLELRRQRIGLPAGAMVHIDSNVRHAVEGLLPTRVLLVLFGATS